MSAGKPAASGCLVRRSDYLEKYHALTRTEGVPFLPYGVWKDAVFSGLILLAIAACALLLRTFRPERTTRSARDSNCAGLIVLLVLPFFSGAGEKSWKRRPIAVLTILLIAVALGTFTNLAIHAPWSPVMDAWTGASIPAKFVSGRTPLQIQGALVFQSKQCHNCHALGDIGGKRGPALDTVPDFWAPLTNKSVPESIL